jgi:hypothetical protein
MVKLRVEITENYSVHKLQSFRIHPKTLKPSKRVNKLMFSTAVLYIGAESVILLLKEEHIL